MNGVDMCLSFNLEQIYDNTSFVINSNDKVGITGVNGAGKTTLFKVILKQQPLDSGYIDIGKKNIGYLPQEIILENPNITVLDYLLTARPIKQLELLLEQLYEKVAVCSIKEQKNILNEIGKTQELLEYYDCYNAENILFDLISNINIDSNLLDMKLNDLSGGQKSKIAFIHLLYEKSEILLLDEPTNHLDIETRQIITDYLKKYNGLILIISHDLNFLDAITNKTLYIDKVNKKIITYDGNYTVFLKKFEKQKELKERLIVKQEKENAKLKEVVLLYSNSSGNRKKMAQSREKQLNKNLKNSMVRDGNAKSVKFKLSPLRSGAKIPLKVNNISFGYNKLLINNLSFVINDKERFLIVGVNGVGKSTLLKLLVNLLQPISGSIVFNAKTDIAYYAQEQEDLDLEKNLLENMDNNFSEREIRQVLGSFLFNGDEVYKIVKFLSPGERARLVLAKIMMKKANFLLLDEPTNHLDPKTQEIIATNFRDYAGTIILVSHNPSFVSNIGIDRMLVLPEGKIMNFDIDKLNYYYNLNKTSL
ncbi:MAG: ABC-F family ATP-binding cassette domain-containing protein [Bacilli bacterium]